MPDQRTHRGPHPDDERLFAADQISALRLAVGDLSWLLSRGYASPSSIKLVGDRYQLEARQRVAVSRCAGRDQNLQRRAAHRLSSAELSGQELWIDGYNVLTTIEAALSHGVIIRGRDNCLRDMASMHGSYHQVTETLDAIRLIGQQLAVWNVGHCRWLFDQAVSNSARLRGTFLESASQFGWNWTVDLVPDPDPILSATPLIVATADSEILNQTGRWITLANEVVERSIAAAWMIDLGRVATDEGRH